MFFNISGVLKNTLGVFIFGFVPLKTFYIGTGILYHKAQQNIVLLTYFIFPRGTEGQMIDRVNILQHLLAHLLVDNQAVS